jgi:opacity protein-like surface antigen
MLRLLAIVCAVIAAAPAPAAAGSRATDRRPASAAALANATAARESRPLQPRVDPGGSAPGISPRDPGSRNGSGWYQRGWGGTHDPGWGYNFGPGLGGFGR